MQRLLYINIAQLSLIPCVQTSRSVHAHSDTAEGLWLEAAGGEYALVFMPFTVSLSAPPLKLDQHNPNNREKELYLSKLRVVNYTGCNSLVLDTYQSKP